MPSTEYHYDPKLKRVVSVDKAQNWFSSTTEQLSRAGADALDSAGQSINLAPAAHRRHASTPDAHKDDELEEDDYAPLFPASLTALEDAQTALEDCADRTRRWLFPPNEVEPPPPPPLERGAAPDAWKAALWPSPKRAPATPWRSWWWQRAGPVLADESANIDLGAGLPRRGV